MMKFKKAVLTLVLCLYLLTCNVFIQAHAQMQPSIDAESAIVIEAINGQILLDHESDQLMEVGSLSKLLVIYLTYQAMDQGQFEGTDLVEISDAAFELSQDYNISNVPLRQDYNYTVNELLESIAVNLANGSTLALAEWVAGSEKNFVKLAEEQLDDWGLSGHYNLYNATGLSASFQIHDVESLSHGSVNQMTAQAVATVAYHLLSDYPNFTQYSSTNQSYFKPKTEDRFEMLNYNLLLPGRLYEYEGVTGLMPAMTHESKASLVASATRDGIEIISVVLGADTEEDKEYSESIKLLDFAFSSFIYEQIVEAGQEANHVGQVEVYLGDRDRVPLYYSEDLSLIVPVTDTAPRLNYLLIERSDFFTDRQELLVPLEAGSQVADVRIEIPGYEMDFLESAKGNLVPVEVIEDLEEANWFSRNWQQVSRWSSQSWESVRQFFTNLFN